MEKKPLLSGADASKYHSTADPSSLEANIELVPRSHRVSGLSDSENKPHAISQKNKEESSFLLQSGPARTNGAGENGAIPTRRAEKSPEKTIDWMGSFALIANNIMGPAMMGLPHLIRAAGIIPFVVVVTLVSICTSINVTMMSDTIASIPRNKKFSRPISFSMAFKMIAGRHWFLLTETLFLLACMVQACVALVATAQSLDGFLASFLIGETIMDNELSPVHKLIFVFISYFFSSSLVSCFLFLLVLFLSIVVRVDYDKLNMNYFSYTCRHHLCSSVDAYYWLHLLVTRALSQCCYQPRWGRKQRQPQSKQYGG